MQERTMNRHSTLGFGDAPKSLFDLYGKPDPETISRLEKPGGVVLHYVGHAEITRVLLEVDPGWTWEPLAIVDGRPAIHLHAGTVKRRETEVQVVMATMWGRLTLDGVTRVAVGSVEAHKPDLDKELVSDFLRNAAMRFGIALTLWMKDDAPVVTPHPASGPRSAPEARTTGAGTDGPKMASDAAKAFLRSQAKRTGYDLPNLGAITARDCYDLTEKLKAMPDAGDEPEEAF
jgi:hypothetical protein